MSKKSMSLFVGGLTLIFSIQAWSISRYFPENWCGTNYKYEPRVNPATPSEIEINTEVNVAVCRFPPPQVIVTPPSPPAPSISNLPELRIDSRTNESLSQSCGALRDRLTSHFNSAETYQEFLAERSFNYEISKSAQRRIQELRNLAKTGSQSATFAASIQNEIACYTDVYDQAQAGYMEASYGAVGILNDLINQATSPTAQTPPTAPYMPKLGPDRGPASGPERTPCGACGNIMLVGTSK